MFLFFFRMIWKIMEVREGACEKNNKHIKPYKTERVTVILSLDFVT